MKIDFELQHTSTEFWLRSGSLRNAVLLALRRHQCQRFSDYAIGAGGETWGIGMRCKLV